MPILPIETPSARYPVVVEQGALGRLASLVEQHAGCVSKTFVVTSPEIDGLWGDAVRAALPGEVHTLHVPAGESAKRMSTVERLCEQLAELRADRDALLVALGGGVIGDITGFVAAIYMRGVDYVSVPTTLLAQVDSSVGGKTGVNLAAGKNLAGAFHHPKLVLADVETLATLPPRELRAGLQECVKAAVLQDPALFEFLESNVGLLTAADWTAGRAAALQHVVEHSVRIKAAVVAADEREQGLRMTLNLGHTVGHAIEAATGYTTLLHGEAVGWGMIAALHLAQGRNAIASAEAARIASLIHRCTELPHFSADAERLLALTGGDKKQRGGALSFILPRGIGRVEIVRDVSPDELRAAIVAMLAEVDAARAVPA